MMGVLFLWHARLLLEQNCRLCCTPKHETSSGVIPKPGSVPPGAGVPRRPDGELAFPPNLHCVSTFWDAGSLSPALAGPIFPRPAVTGATPGIFGCPW